MWLILTLTVFLSARWISQKGKKSIDEPTIDQPCHHHTFPYLFQCAF